MSNVDYSLLDNATRILNKTIVRFDGGGGSGYDGGMENRVSKLETDLTAIKIDLAVIKSNYATKSDLAVMESTILKWFIGTAIALTSLAFVAARFIH